MHVHGPGDVLAGMLAYGITTVRDVGGSWPHSLADAERVMTLRQPGPSFLLAEEIFEGPDPVWETAFTWSRRSRRPRRSSTIAPAMVSIW
jgi:hypothetical protein